jgi:DNA invertase Pin-like site-specific DNA recombinase
MLASRRNGKWVGGIPPLGYDVAAGGGKLIVNEAEAQQVRTIFALYLEHRDLILNDTLSAHCAAHSSCHNPRTEASNWAMSSTLSFFAMTGA